jgi:hypothetical protein
LFSARVFKKFLTVSPLSAPPMCRCSSCTICDLSLGVKVGAVRIVASLGSFLKTSDRAARDLAVPSSAEVFAAAVYCMMLPRQPSTIEGEWRVRGFFISYQRARIRPVKAK